MTGITTEVWFLAFCVEIYKTAKEISGQVAYKYLRRTGATKYIIECCDALHTTGAEYIVDSIDDFIENNHERV